jgi:hypothetical protein
MAAPHSHSLCYPVPATRRVTRCHRAQVYAAGRTPSARAPLCSTPSSDRARAQNVDRIAPHRLAERRRPCHHGGPVRGDYTEAAPHRPGVWDASPALGQAKQATPPALGRRGRWTEAVGQMRPGTVPWFSFLLN